MRCSLSQSRNRRSCCVVVPKLRTIGSDRSIDQETHHHRVLVHVEPGATRIQFLHGRLRLNKRRAGRTGVGRQSALRGQSRNLGIVTSSGSNSLAGLIAPSDSQPRPGDVEGIYPIIGPTFIISGGDHITCELLRRSGWECREMTQTRNVAFWHQRDGDFAKRTQTGEQR
jgi:hypothetical protein